MNNKLVFFLLCLFVCLTMISCSKVQTVPETDAENPEAEEAPALNGDEITKWVEYSSSMFLGQSREYAGKQYFLVTYGEKDSNGYAVEITKTEILEDRVNVYVTLIEPGPDEIVESITTYPYDLAVIDATGRPAEFIVTGGLELVIPRLLGVEYLKPVTAASPGIKIFHPAPNQEIGGILTVEGIANVFEGNFQYKLSDNNGRIVLQGYNTAAMGDWKYFSIAVDINPYLQLEPQLKLELFTESAEDGSVENHLTIPLQR